MNITFEKHPASKQFIDLTGHKYERWTVLGFAGHGSKGRSRLWWCKCECGSISKVTAINLRNGHSKSCGCFCKERISATRTVHGISDTRTHRSWMSMRDRCQNPKARPYKNYGGRGISVCDRWISFPKFLEDMGLCPEGFTLERIDVHGNYEPSNCKWASRIEQANNTRRNRFITINGQSMTLANAARLGGVSLKSLWYRLSAGWSEHEAVFGKPRS